MLGLRLLAPLDAGCQGPDAPTCACVVVEGLEAMEAVGLVCAAEVSA